MVFCIVLYCVVLCYVILYYYIYFVNNNMYCMLVMWLFRVCLCYYEVKRWMIVFERIRKILKFLEIEVR